MGFKYCFCFFVMAGLGIAQAPSSAPKPPGPVPGAPRAMPPAPKAGICPLPILPALPGDSSTDFWARAEVPHGTVEMTNYRNYAGLDKRMHVYLPPGYVKDGKVRYPVLYLNHGGGDDDSKWTQVDARSGGAAANILDNLIAAGKAKPMIVIMPETKCSSPMPSAPGKDDACTTEYLKDIVPYADTHYQTIADRRSRALAGLSMGGFVVMNTGLPHLDTFSELYVYSSGYFPDQQKAFEENYAELLKNPATNDLFRVPFYMAAGETDIALKNAESVVSIINKYGVRNFWVLSSRGHELEELAAVSLPDGADHVSGVRGKVITRPRPPCLSTSSDNCRWWFSLRCSWLWRSGQ